MKIITTRVAQKFNDVSHCPCAGFVSGPVRALLAIAQGAINTTGAAITVIPSKTGLIKKDSSFHSTKLVRHAKASLTQLVRALIDTAPCTCCCMDGNENVWQKGMNGGPSSTRGF